MWTLTEAFDMYLCDVMYFAPHDWLIGSLHECEWMNVWMNIGVPNKMDGECIHEILGDQMLINIFNW